MPCERPEFQGLPELVDHQSLPPREVHPELYVERLPPDRVVRPELAEDEQRLRPQRVVEEPRPEPGTFFRAQPGPHRQGGPEGPEVLPVAPEGPEALLPERVEREKPFPLPTEEPSGVDLGTHAAGERKVSQVRLHQPQEQQGPELFDLLPSGGE